MSFFFTKKSTTKPTAKPVTGNQASKETLNRLGCTACPLNKADNATPKMAPDLGADGSIYFLGDSPSEIDDAGGAPFTDKAGKLLKSLLDRDVRDNASFDNVARDTGSSLNTQWVAMECCRSKIIKSIEETKPKVIIGLGIQPLQWMLNSSDMIGLRGRLFAVKVGNHSCWFLPTYHPSFVIKTAFKGQDPLRSKLGHCLKFDIAAGVTALRLPKPQIEAPNEARAGLQTFDGKGAGQLAQVLKLLNEAHKAPEKAIDIETSHLRPYAAGALLLTVAISFKDTNFSFALQHPKAGWSKAQREQLTDALFVLLTGDTKIIAHNTPFECEWFIWLLGKEVIRHEVWECTMMQAHFLDERRGKRGGNDDQYQPNPYQALDFLIKQHFGLSYKPLFKLDRKNMAKADLQETLLYNAADTKYTLRLHHKQTFDLKARGLHNAYFESVSRQPTVALMQSLGISTNPQETADLKKQLEIEIAEITHQIHQVPEVKRFLQDRKTYNPDSQPETIKLLRDYIKVGDQIKNAEGKDSVDKNILDAIDHPIAPLIISYRNRGKLKSTYVDPYEPGTGKFIWPDKKIHPAFNTTFAETGRTSSDEPNQQNWPSRNDKQVRKQIVAEKGHVLVAFDFGQLEACTAAMCTKDKVLVKALWEDYDIHMEWSIKAANQWPEFIGGLENLKDKALMKEFRSKIKNKLVFPVFFGATNNSVAGYLNAPIEPINALMDEFWATFRGVYNWQKRIMSRYYETGYVESPTLRRRHFPLSKNQAVNYPIQSVACDIVCNAMCELSDYASESGEWYMHPIMNIHDDLTFSIPNEKPLLDDAIIKIYQTMLSPPYDFINVPLSVTCSVGTNWLEMEEIDKFWSHKDL